jgi:hypothetical protein
MHDNHGPILAENYWQEACEDCCYFFFGERYYSWIKKEKKKKKEKKNNEEIIPLRTAQETDSDPCRRQQKGNWRTIYY